MIIKYKNFFKKLEIFLKGEIIIETKLTKMHTVNMNFIKPKGSPKLLAYNPMQDINSPIHGKILIYEYSISNSINGP
ncbi:hypothetical protein B8V65_06995 [Streptococcus agalactiae]|nr:hypothetical protein B8V65_06995 [Streptococcus agalactiae]